MTELNSATLVFEPLFQEEEEEEIYTWHKQGENAKIYTSCSIIYLRKSKRNAASQGCFTRCL